MSRPTEIMLVASATSTGLPSLAERQLEPLLGLGDLVGRDARGQLQRSRAIVAVGERRDPCGSTRRRCAP